MAMVRQLTGRVPTTVLLSASAAVTGLTAVAYNVDRVTGVLQNLATAKLYLKFGGACTTAASGFSVVLVGGSAVDDGAGGVQPLDNYVGEISVASAGAYRFVVTEVIG